MLGRVTTRVDGAFCFTGAGDGQVDQLSQLADVLRVSSALSSVFDAPSVGLDKGVLRAGGRLNGATGGRFIVVTVGDDDKLYSSTGLSLVVAHGALGAIPGVGGVGNAAQ